MLKELQKRLGDSTLVLKNGMVSDPNITYYTGLRDNSGILYVTKSKAFFVRNKSLNEAAEKQCTCKVKIVEDVNEWLKEQNPTKIAINESRLSYSHSKRLRKIAPIVSFSKELEDIRAVKTKEELRRIRKARSMALSLLEGMTFEGTERNIYSRFMYEMHLVADPAFELIVAADRNSRYPHHISGSKRPKNMLLVDFGVRYKNYHSDITRMHYFKKNLKMEKAHVAVEAAIEAAMSAAIPGATGAEVDRAACEVLAGCGYAKNILHATGHGLGVELHERPSLAPNSKDVLKEGMIFTIEPGIYFSNFGIRLEDDYIVTKKGAKVI